MVGKKSTSIVSGGRYSKVITRDLDTFEKLSRFSKESKSIKDGYQSISDYMVEYLKSKDLPYTPIVYHEKHLNWMPENSAPTSTDSSYLDSFIINRLEYDKDELEGLAARIITACHGMLNSKGDLILKKAFQMGEAYAFFKVYSKINNQQRKGGKRKSRKNIHIQALVKKLMNEHPGESATSLYNILLNIDEPICINSQSQPIDCESNSNKTTMYLENSETSFSKSTFLKYVSSMK